MQGFGVFSAFFHENFWSIQKKIVPLQSNSKETIHISSRRSKQIIEEIRQQIAQNQNQQ